MLKYKTTFYLIGLAVIGSFFPVLITNAYFVHLLTMTIIFAILALSLDIIIGQMGQFSFGHQAFFGIGAYTTAILTTRFNVPLWVAIFAGIALPGILGLIVGLMSLRRARGFFLGIITLAVVKLVTLTTYSWQSLTNGRGGIANVPPIRFSFFDWVSIELDKEYKFYYFALVALILVIYLIQAGIRSRLGRAICAIRENEDLAKSIGINTYLVYVVAFTFACALAGFAGVLYAHYMKLAPPNLFNHEITLWLLIIVVVGGSRSFTGIIFGAVIYIFLPEWFDFAKEYRMILISILLLVCILFLRQGIVPTILRYMKNWLEWRQAFRANRKKSIRT